MNFYPVYDRITLTQNIRHDSRHFETGEPFFQAAAFEEQLLMMQSQQMQNRGMEIMNADWIFDHAVTEVIGGAVTRAASNAAAGHP